MKKGFVDLRFLMLGCSQLVVFHLRSLVFNSCILHVREIIYNNYQRDSRIKEIIKLSSRQKLSSTRCKEEVLHVIQKIPRGYKMITIPKF